MARFILVHGAWHGGWCWERVSEVLIQRGHAVLAPDLPGHGEDSTPTADVTLDGYADRILECLETLPGAHLVGHSLGGISISAAAAKAPDAIKQLIYLCAMAPTDGDSANSVGRINVASGIPTSLQSNEDGTAITVKESAVARVFYNDCDEAAIELAKSKLVPQSTAVMGTKLTLNDRFAAIPKAYIECIEDNAIGIAGQRAIAERAGISRMESLNTSHSPFFSAPLLLAHSLEKLAGEHP